MYAVFWSMLFNISGSGLGSMLDKPDTIEQVQAVSSSAFSNASTTMVIRCCGEEWWNGGVTRVSGALHQPRTALSEALDRYACEHDINSLQADSQLTYYTERLLAGTIGAALERVMISSISFSSIS